VWLPNRLPLVFAEDGAEKLRDRLPFSGPLHLQATVLQLQVFDARFEFLGSASKLVADLSGGDLRRSTL
jgi:hypothetical protein